VQNVVQLHPPPPPAHPPNEPALPSAWRQDTGKQSPSSSHPSSQLVCACIEASQRVAARVAGVRADDGGRAGRGGGDRRGCPASRLGGLSEQRRAIGSQWVQTPRHGDPIGGVGERAAARAHLAVGQPARHLEAAEHGPHLACREAALAVHVEARAELLDQRPAGGRRAHVPAAR
jgi:hypothetical protein